MSAKLFPIICVCFLFAAGAAHSGLAAPDGRKRARIAECMNTPAAQLLLVRLDRHFRDIGNTPPSWQTLPSETVQDAENLEDAFVISAYDMIITSDGEYAQKLESLGLTRKTVPIFRERIVLAGPPDAESEMDGLPASDAMKIIFDRESLFFSMLTERRILDAEGSLWKDAGVDAPSGSRGYVETGRDAVSALMQAGDEGGFILVGEASFAQFEDAERGETRLVKLSDTGLYRTTFACLASNSGFRKERTADAERCLEWVGSDEGKNAVSDFSMGGISPFIPAE
ncbi:MAG: hypothetical protein LBQ36_03440 [Synergistaceae bacterium]|nr:hypothetical protein [Synergistaceae bacterium]